MSVVIRKVESQADFQAFFEFPWTLYKDDPNWTPVLLSMRRDTLDKKKNPAWDYMEGDYFTAWRGNQLVGTITAHINHRHNEVNHEHIGWFGFFETINDAETAETLLNAAAEWVKARGYDAIRGPQSFTTHEECGLLIDNFSQPMLLMPYNPPYYQTLVENAGWYKVMDVYSVYYDRKIADEFHTDERFSKIVKRTMERNHVSVRPIDMRRKKEEFRLFRDLYNAAWDVNWGFVPMTDKELDALVKSLGMFFEPSMAFFAEVKGTPVGFSLAIPNLNEVLHRVYPRPGEPEIWSLLKAGWYWKIKKVIRGVRLPLMGVLNQHRNKGIEIALLDATLKALMPSQYEYLDASWILETNQLLTIVGKVGGKPYKTHRFYQRDLK